ncbi:hypothetical protein GW17_00039100 [Ensete ventricosum]|nr:hypothetical protein GW17_00039100 [Ensete ventricosum]
MIAQVITETLRTGNIISGIMRKAVKDVEIRGHLIPKGWCVLTYFRSVHLDENHYGEAYSNIVTEISIAKLRLIHFHVHVRVSACIYAYAITYVTRLCTRTEPLHLVPETAELC